ncbi:MAG TPA: hypothetical protein VF688_04525 [Allosphingosinicella sp.]|jgi:hypothetical protein
MNQDGDGKRTPYGPLTCEERARFLQVLRETGNRKAAAAAIGVDPRLMDQRRQHDPELDRDWEAAADDAHRGLSGASGPFDCPQMGKLNMIRRGKRGRLQLVSTGEDRWNAAVERRFLEALRLCGSVRGAARAVGFSEGAIWERRRKWPAFAKALEELLEEVELSLEFQLGCLGSNVVPMEEGAAEEVEYAVPPVEGVRFDPEAAMRFLKWREEKRRGGGRRTPHAKPPSIEEVTEKIVRRVQAIKRHRERGGGPP